jgi:hypothetical protein
MRIAKKLIVTAGVAAAAATAGGVIAYAAIPSADNTITACVGSAGVVRIIDTEAGQTCTTSEKQISWGGGMRYIGKWSNIGSRPKLNGYPIINKGDVVYYDGAPNAFGCTSPRGSWVSVAGSYAYPCLESPQNWAPLALDGRGSEGHWATVSGTGALTGSSDTNVATYPNSTGSTWVYFPTLDASKCAIEANASDYRPTVLATAYRWGGGWVLLTAYDTTNRSYVAAAIDLTVSCGKY